MQITVIGSSHGVPEPNRRCSSILLTVEKNNYFIDMGTQSSEALRTMGISADSVKGIFLTHMHGDHTNGLITFLDLASWYFKTCNPTVLFPETDGIEPLKAWLHANGTELRDEIILDTVKEGVTYDDGVLKLTAFRTKHCRTSYAYLAEAEGKRVVFSGDLCGKGPENDFPMTVFDAPVDLLFCEGAHFAVTAYLPLFSGKDISEVVVNHYVTGNYPHILTLQKELAPIPVTVAADGMQFTL